MATTSPIETHPPLHHVRRGSGPPLPLIHGLGGTWRSSGHFPQWDVPEETVRVILDATGS